MTPNDRLRPNLIGRLKAASTAFWKPSAVGFGPGEPIRPQAPQEQVRREDYQVARNIQFVPRASEARNVTFAQMRALSRTNGVLRTVIEKRKDQLKGLEWTIAPRLEYAHQDYSSECLKETRWLQKPDGDNSFDQWLGTALEDLFVIDALTLYQDKDMSGVLQKLDIVDGSTILVLVDDVGRIPDSPVPAYEQVIKGMPRTWWTKDEMLYRPFNVASDGVYGFSHVESIIMTVNIAIRRDTTFLEWFRSGNVPAGFMPTPPEWTPDQIVQFSNMFNTMLEGDLSARAKIHAVPGAGTVQMIEPLTFDAVFDEWLARIICARFGVSPAPYVRMMERATAQSVQEAATEESVVPLMSHLKALFDDVLAKGRKKPHLEFIWTTGQLHYRKEDADINQSMVNMGAMTLDELRKQKGLPVFRDGIGAKPMIWTSNGPVKLEDIASGKFTPGQPMGEGNGNGSSDELPRLSIGEVANALPAPEPEPEQSFELSIRSYKSELDAWERFELNRLGKPGARTFEAKVLPPSLVSGVRASLNTAKTGGPKAVKTVFDEARRNISRQSRLPAVDKSLDDLIKEYEKVLVEAMDKAK